MADIVNILAAAAGAVPTAATDPNFNQTVLLLHGDGTNGAQNNTFLDSSTNNFTITRNGNTTQGTFSPFSLPDGRWSNYFDGSGDYLDASSTLKDLGTGDFCIEFWIYWNGGAMVIDTRDESNVGWMVSATPSAPFEMRFYHDGSNKVTGSIELNEWTHFAVTRSSGTLRLFVNGAQADSTTYTANLSDGDDFRIASKTYSSSTVTDLNGYLSSLRIVAGSAVYTSAFTPPTAPLTAIANTSLLTCQSNRFVDNSSNGYAITAAGTPKVTPFSPFAPTAAYDASVNGGSGYFDGTGDNLDVPASLINIGTSDFCVEAWVYSTGSAENQEILGAVISSANTTTIFLFEIENDGDLRARIGGSSQNVLSSSPVPNNSWNHVAASRESGTLRVFLNGALVGTTVISATDLTGFTEVRVGSLVISTGGPRVFNGYISNLRFSDSAIYTAAFTPPTAPFVDSSGTELLLNFANAGIFDQTGKNNLETVGNAQIDTTTKKYGTGSMEFDGTGDWLLMPHSLDQQLGTGDFTIEFWVYLATGDAGSNRGLVAKGTSTTGFLVSLNTTEKVVFTFTTSTITSTGAITLDAWNHITVVREGTGSNETKIYIGGTNDGTGTVSTDFNQTSVMYVGANRTGGDPMKGFIDDLRITKGVARYTTTFTPPTKAFPDL